MKTILSWRQMFNDERYSYACDVDDNTVVFVRHEGTFEIQRTRSNGVIGTMELHDFKEVITLLKKFGYDI